MSEESSPKNKKVKVPYEHVSFMDGVNFMQIYNDLTLATLLDMCRRIHEVLGPGRKERTYQRCLMSELHHAGYPAVMEDPVPVFYQGNMVAEGRADIVLGRCCIELKANSKAPASASKQLEDYCREKNKVVLMEHGVLRGPRENQSMYFSTPEQEDSRYTPSDVPADRFFFGIVINWNSVFYWNHRREGKILSTVKDHDNIIVSYKVLIH